MFAAAISLAAVMQASPAPDSLPPAVFKHETTIPGMLRAMADGSFMRNALPYCFEADKVKDMIMLRLLPDKTFQWEYMFADQWNQTGAWLLAGDTIFLHFPARRDSSHLGINMLPPHTRAYVPERHKTGDYLQQLIRNRRGKWRKERIISYPFYPSSCSWEN